MALTQFFSGFELGSAEDVAYGLGSDPWIIAQDPAKSRTGACYAKLQLRSAGTAVAAYNNLTGIQAPPSAVGDCYASKRFYYRANVLPNKVVGVGGFFTGACGWAAMYVAADGTFGIEQSANWTSEVPIGTLTTGIWYRCELVYHVHNDYMFWGGQPTPHWNHEGFGTNHPEYNYYETTLSVWTDAGVLVASGTTGQVTGTGSFTITRAFIGGGGVTAATCEFDFDDWYYQADDAGAALPTATRVSPVRISGQGSSAGFTGSWKNVRKWPGGGISPVSIQTSSVSGQSTTFLHADAATLGIGNVVATKVGCWGSIGAGGSAVLLSGAAELTPLPSAFGTTYGERCAQEFTARTPAEFDAWQFGFRNKANLAANLEGVMACVLHDGTPIDPETTLTSFEMATGTYAATGAPFEVTGLGFRPGAVLIVSYGSSASAAHGAIRTSSMAGTWSIDLGSGAAVGCLIGAFTDDGFEVQQGDAVNLVGTNFFWIALGDGGHHSNGYFMRVGAYVGDGIDNRDLVVSPGWAPDIVLASSSGYVPCHRAPAHAGDQTTDWKNATTDTVTANLIQSVGASGFQIGSAATVNLNLRNEFWIAFRFGTSGLLETLMGSGKYTGTGSPIAGAISALPFIPALILAKPKTVPMEWRGRNAQTTTGSNAVGTPAGSHTTFITALNTDGCDVGVALSDASSAGHFWLAFGYPTAAESVAGRGGIPSDILPPEFGGAQLEGSFGPVVWVEFSSPDGSIQVWSTVPLPDPSAYYYGYKSPTLLTAGRISRALSDEQGQYSAQRFSFTRSDIDRYLSTLLASDQVILNRRVVMRLISDEERRALGTPRTVGIGLVRSYQGT